MQFLAAILGGYLHARNHLKAIPGGLPSGTDAFERVMVGDGNGRQAAAPRRSTISAGV